MKDLIVPLRECLLSENNLNEFGKILHLNWQLKKTITGQISTDKIDEIYNSAIKAGASGGKLLGAGGGGFLLFYAEPQHHTNIIKALSPLYAMPIAIDTSGSRITYYDSADT